MTTISTQTLVDSTKRNLTKVVTVMDTNTVANTVILKAANLSFAMNTTGQVSNTNPKSFYRTNIKRIFGQATIKSNGYISLIWSSKTNTDVIVTIGNGIFDYNFEPMGLAATIPTQNTDPNSQSTGDILISVVNAAAAGDAATKIGRAHV